MSPVCQSLKPLLLNSGTNSRPSFACRPHCWDVIDPRRRSESTSQFTASALNKPSSEREKERKRERGREGARERERERERGSPSGTRLWGGLYVSCERNDSLAPQHDQDQPPSNAIIGAVAPRSHDPARCLLTRCFKLRAAVSEAGSNGRGMLSCCALGTARNSARRRFGGAVIKRRSVAMRPNHEA